MTEDEFSNSGVDQASQNYLLYLEEIRGLAREGLVNMPNRGTPLQHLPLFNALLVIGAWGALEAYVSDFCLAVLRDAPHRLDQNAVKSFKIPISELLGDHDQRTRILFRELDSKTSGGNGVSRFENLLKYIDADGPVPPTVQTDMFAAQQIRNVWAHKAGRADLHFVEQVPFLGYSQGDTVALDAAKALTYISTFTMYGMVVISRWRVKNGLRAYANPPGTPWKEEYDAIFPPQDQMIEEG